MTHRSHSFGTRLTSLLAQIYPRLDADILASQVIDAYWPEGTHRRIRPRRPGNNMWSQRDAVLITYGDSLIDGVNKPLSLLHDFLRTHMKGVVNGVHILPFFPWSSDDGFSVTDYRKVDGKLGDWSDITRIGQDFHLMSDLVLNHASSQSGWFNEFLLDHPPYNGFFVTADPADDLSAVVRPRTTPLLREVETATGPLGGPRSTVDTAWATVTVAEPLTLLPCSCAVMDAVPFPIAVTSPVLDTVATLASLDDQLNVAPETGVPDAVADADRFAVSPRNVSVAEPGARATRSGVCASGGVDPSLPQPVRATRVAKAREKRRNPATMDSLGEGWRTVATSRSYFGRNGRN